MKLQIKVGLVLSTLLSFITSADDINFYNYSFGVNYQYLTVQDIDFEGQTIDGGSGHALGLYYKGEPYPYTIFSIGADYMLVEDVTPFRQTVKNQFNDDVSTKSSDITGFGMYGEAGLVYKFDSVKSLSFGALAGYRFNNVERTILHCSGCESQDLDDFDNSAYGKLFVEYQFTSDVHAQLSYIHFLSDTGFENSLGLQISFAAF